MSRPDLELADAVARARRSVVRVVAADGSGSGTVLGSGYVVTSAHVVQGGVSSVVDDDGVSWAATVVGVDHERDLALLRVPGLTAPSLRMAKVMPRPGALVLAVGYPGGQFATTAGVAVGTRMRQASGEFRAMLTDLRLRRGYSGGAIVDAAGALVAIGTLVLGGMSAGADAASVRAFLRTLAAEVFDGRAAGDQRDAGTGRLAG